MANPPSDPVPLKKRPIVKRIGVILSCFFLTLGSTYAIDRYILHCQDQRRLEIASLVEKADLLGHPRVPFSPEADPGLVLESYLKGKGKNDVKIKGSLATDFNLEDLVTKKKINLASYRNHKPVVLLFGSFGCDLFCGQLNHLQSLYQDYQDRVQFVVVYITEGPHHIFPSIPSESKNARILRGINHFQLTMPCVLADPKIEDTYNSFPLLFVGVGLDGKINLETRKSRKLQEWLKNQLNR